MPTRNRIEFEKMSLPIGRVDSLVVQLLAGVCLLLCCSSSSQDEALRDDTPVCRDESGNPVDWFIAYKFPMIIGMTEPFGSGEGYAYISSELIDAKPDEATIEDDELFLDNFKRLLHEHLGVPLTTTDGNTNGQPGWTMAKYPINHKDSMILRSLAPAYSPTKPSSLNWIFYNDHPAKPIGGDYAVKPSSNRAHAKGSLLIDDSNGDAVWLSHSVPQFPPPVQDPLIFSDNAYRNGQTFVCLSIDGKKDGAKVVNHLANMFALIYHSNVSPELRRMIPEVEKLKLEGERTGLGKSQREDSLDQFLSTRGGQEFELFSKSSNLRDDFYAGWLAQELDSSLYVESWRSGFGNPLDSDCPRNKHQVNNIKSMRLISNSRTLFSWPYTKDHSKWAISEAQDEGVVCLADINRMSSQFKRGGGAVCIKSPIVWTIFSSTIEELEPCQYKTTATKKKKSKFTKIREKFVEKIKKLLL